MKPYKIGAPRVSGQIANVMACLALVAGIALVILAAYGDLWLDKIWSIEFAEQASSLLDVFSMKHDNNHVLNTAYLYLFGSPSYFYSYRLLSVISGITFLLIVYRLYKIQKTVGTLLTLLIAVASYPLVLYFSEARGYGPAMLLALLSLLQFQRCRSQYTPVNLILFWSLTILGMLAQFTFVTFLIALGCSSLIYELSSRPIVPGRLKRIALLFLPPAITLSVLYVFFINSMTIGGGDRFSYGNIIGHACTVLLGLPDGAGWSCAAILLFLIIVCAGTILLYRDNDHLWAFYPAVLLFAPAMMLIISRPEVLYFRYFVICFPFFYMLLGAILGKVCRSHKRSSSYVVGALVVAFLIGQSYRLTQLLRHGRGNYSAALQYIVDNTPSPIIRIGSDHDFRNGMLLSFYSRFLPEGKKMEYVEGRFLWGEQKPDWFITHSQDMKYIPPQALQYGGVYQLVKYYPFAGDSGWSWYIYSRSR